MGGEQAGREAKLERLILAISDMADAAAAARFLRTTEGLLLHVRRALETGMSPPTLARSILRGGTRRFRAAPTSELSPADRGTHEWALAERDMVWAHVDRGGHRRATEVRPGPPPAFVGAWTPPTPEQFAALEALADKLNDRYVPEATELWRALQG